MLKDYLPQRIDPFRSASQALRMHGYLMVRNMERLCPSLSSNEGDVEVDLTFGIDDKDVPVVQGQISANLMLQCQRCMEPFNYEIINNFVLGIVHKEEEAEHLPEGYDPVIADEGMLAVQDMIEDELMVGLPLVAMHDPKACKIGVPYKTSSGQTLESNNPFNVISILRSKDDSKKE